MPSAPSLSERFTILLKLMANAAFGHKSVDPANAAVLEFVKTRLRRTVLRLVALLARLAIDPQPEPAAQPRARPKSPRPARPKPPGQISMPNRIRWLRHLIPTRDVSLWCGSFEALMRDPELVTLMAISAKLRSILRPLCRMTGIHPLPVILRLPGSPKTARRIKPKPAEPPPEPQWQPPTQPDPQPIFRYVGMPR